MWHCYFYFSKISKYFFHRWSDGARWRPPHANRRPLWSDWNVSELLFCFLSTFLKVFASSFFKNDQKTSGGFKHGEQTSGPPHVSPLVSEVCFFFFLVQVWRFQLFFLKSGRVCLSSSLQDSPTEPNRCLSLWTTTSSFYIIYITCALKTSPKLHWLKTLQQDPVVEEVFKFFTQIKVIIQQCRNTPLQVLYSRVTQCVDYIIRLLELYFTVVAAPGGTSLSTLCSVGKLDLWQEIQEDNAGQNPKVLKTLFSKNKWKKFAVKNGQYPERRNTKCVVS